MIAPPYDVIDPELQDQLYKKHPANVVRLILNRDEPGDDEHSNRYTRAARLLRNWLREGVLFTEADPAIYVYHQVFTEGGTTFTRRGFMCRVRLERFGEGNIYPHEETHGGAKADRLQAVEGVQGEPQPDLRPLSRPGERRPRTFSKRRSPAQTPLEATDHLGVVHRIWPVTDVAMITAGRPPRWAASRCTSPTATIATRRPATSATTWRPSLLSAARSSRPSTRPTSC